MLLAARHQKAVLQEFGLQDMWTNYTKWTAEAVLPDHRALLLWLSGKRPGAFRRSPGTAGYAAFRRHVGQRRLKRCPRREASEHPVWELLRSGKVKAVKDVSELLHP